MEIWKKIDGYDYYFVSNTGIVKSIDRIKKKKNGVNQIVKGTIMKTKLSKGGYIRVPLVDENGYQRFHLVHRLVLISFIGVNEQKKQVNHINGDKSDNSLINLEWVTCSENQKHAHKIGLKSQKGENHTQARLKESDVLEIREMIQKGFKQRDIAEKFRIKRAYVSHIKTRKAWSHI
jgi:predicted XRE-type DNA-binding protein